MPIYSLTLEIVFLYVIYLLINPVLDNGLGMPFLGNKGNFNPFPTIDSRKETCKNISQNMCLYMLVNFITKSRAMLLNVIRLGAPLGVFMAQPHLK